MADIRPVSLIKSCMSAVLLFYTHLVTKVNFIFVWHCSFRPCMVDSRYKTWAKVLSSSDLYLVFCVCRWRSLCLGSQRLQSAGKWHHQPRPDSCFGFHQPHHQEGDRGGLWLSSHHSPHHRGRGKKNKYAGYDFIKQKMRKWTIFLSGFFPHISEFTSHRTKQ